MKILGYCILLYGREYLDVTIQSVLPFCDKIIILYTPHPSQGYRTDEVCPETKEELKAICDKYDKIEWKDTDCWDEGTHTGEIYKYSEGYDVLLRFDADEVFEPKDLVQALKTIEETPYEEYGIDGFHHFWKSFNNVITDGFRPVRFIKPAGEGRTDIKCRIYHFGYAQNIETIRYKMTVSGHKSEWRTEWWDTYLNWGISSRFLHPTSIGVWEKAEPFNRFDLPEILHLHPNFNKLVI